MPTYEYVCTECGHDLEVVQSFTDDALTECPNCHGKLRKVFGNVGVSFKGSGFYKTDSRGKSASPSSTGESKPSETKSPETKSTESTAKPSETKSSSDSSTKAS